MTGANAAAADRMDEWPRAPLPFTFVWISRSYAPQFLVGRSAAFDALARAMGVTE